MKNPFRRFLRSAEYRHLASRLQQVEDDLLKVMNISEKVNARERQRARRGMEEPPDPQPVPAALLHVDDPGPSVEPNGDDRAGMRARLRARAKQRGLMA